VWRSPPDEAPPDEAHHRAVNGDASGRILQAQGMVSAQAGCNIDDALALMTARASTTGQSVNEVATGVLDGSVRLQGVSDTPLFFSRRGRGFVRTTGQPHVQVWRRVRVFDMPHRQEVVGFVRSALPCSPRSGTSRGLHSRRPSGVSRGKIALPEEGAAHSRRSGAV
jgi:hypothetical protein